MIECKAGDLHLGDQVIQTDGDFPSLTGTVREEHPNGIAGYNFEVERPHFMGGSLCAEPLLR